MDLVDGGAPLRPDRWWDSLASAPRSVMVASSAWVTIRSMSWLIGPPVRTQVAHPPISTAPGAASMTVSSTSRLRSVISGG